MFVKPKEKIKPVVFQFRSFFVSDSVLFVKDEGKIKSAFLD